MQQCTGCKKELYQLYREASFPFMMMNNYLRFFVLKFYKQGSMKR